MMRWDNCGRSRRRSCTDYLYSMVSDVAFWPWLCSYKIFITAGSYTYAILFFFSCIMLHVFFCRSSEPSVLEETIPGRCMIMCWRSKCFGCDLVYCILFESLKLTSTDLSGVITSLCQDALSSAKAVVECLPPLLWQAWSGEGLWR